MMKSSFIGDLLPQLLRIKCFTRTLNFFVTHEVLINFQLQAAPSHVVAKTLNITLSKQCTQPPTSE